MTRLALNSENVCDQWQNIHIFGYLILVYWIMTRGGFLIRRSSAIRRFIAGFLKCDSRTIMKSFLKKIACELTGTLHKNPPKFPENSRAIFLRNDFIIVRLSYLRNPANRRAASDEKPTPGIHHILLCIV